MRRPMRRSSAKVAPRNTRARVAGAKKTRKPQPKKKRAMPLKGFVRNNLGKPDFSEMLLRELRTRYPKIPAGEWIGIDTYARDLSKTAREISKEPKIRVKGRRFRTEETINYGVKELLQAIRDVVREQRR